MNKVLLRPLFRNAYLKKSEKKLDVKKFNVGGFSKVEKRNLLLTPITSALLQARKMRGEGELGALARAFGKGIQGLPQTQLAIREIEQREEEESYKKFEDQIKQMMLHGAGNRDIAIKWILEAEGLENESDANYICYNLGLSYDKKYLG